MGHSGKIHIYIYVFERRDGWTEAFNRSPKASVHMSFRRAQSSRGSWSSVQEQTRCVPYSHALMLVSGQPVPRSPKKVTTFHVLRFMQVVDYRAVDLVEHLKAEYASPERQFDVLYDCAGLTPALYSSSPAYLTPTGIFVDICAMATPKETGGPVRSFVRLLERTWRPAWLGGTPRRYKSAVLLAHNSVRGVVVAPLPVRFVITALVDCLYLASMA